MATRIESMDDLKIKFDGQTHQIEANTLITSLLHFTSIVQEVNKELGTGRKVEIKVNALPEGSFLVHFTLQTIYEVIQSDIFQKENLSIAKELIDTVSGLYRLIQFLRGKNPKSVKSDEGKTVIENVQGDVIIMNQPIVNIYQNNRTVKEALSQEFANLENDPYVTGMEILDKNDNPLVIIPRDQFSTLANPEDEPIQMDEKNIFDITHLTIYTLSFDRNVKWTFLYKGNKVQAKISEDFYEKIENRTERFGKGDHLEVELEIRQQLDKSVNDYINKSYKILRVLNHLPQSDQQTLFPK